MNTAQLLGASQNELRQNIGKRISKALAIRGKKQKELAAAIGIQDNTVSYWASGSRTPNTEQIVAISKYLNVPSDYLLGLTPNMTTNTSVQAICQYTGIGEEEIRMLHDHIFMCDSTDATDYVSRSIRQTLQMYCEMRRCKNDMQ